MDLNRRTFFFSALAALGSIALLPKAAPKPIRLSGPEPPSTSLHEQVFS